MGIQDLVGERLNSSGEGTRCGGFRLTVGVKSGIMQE